MPLKTILFSLGCVLAWFVLLPLLLIGGGLALFAYAVFAELGAFLTGSTSNTLDISVAREIARRMCGGYSMPARSSRRRASRSFSESVRSAPSFAGPAPGQYHRDRIIPDGANNDSRDGGREPPAA